MLIMRNIFVISLFFLLLLLSSVDVLAQRQSPDAAKMRVAEEKLERAAALTEQRQDKIRMFFAKMMERIEAAIARLQKLIERIEARIVKIKEENPDADLSDQEDKLTEAKDMLDDAKEKLQELKDDFESLLESGEPKEVFKKIGEDIRNLKQDLVEIHRTLVYIIGDIKGLRVGQNKPTATP